MDERRRVRRALALALCLSLCALCLSGCLAGVTEYEPDSPPGFLTGVWHGWIAPLSLVMQLLGVEGVRMYETANGGVLYDLGFYMAVIAGFGGLALIRRRRRK